MIYTNSELIPKFQIGGQFGLFYDMFKQQSRNPQMTKRADMGGMMNLSSSFGNVNNLSSLAPKNTLAPPPGDLNMKTGRPGISMDTVGNVAGGVGAAAGLASGLVDSFAKPGKTNTFGITAQNNKANIASSTLGTAASWAATGATVGGPWGAAIGLVGGTIAGLLKSKKKAKEDDTKYKDSTQAAYEDYNQKANAQQYAALAKCGTKLHIAKKLSGSKKNAISYKNRKFKKGGKLDKVGEVNIIPSGTLHKENNNLGQKDKGLPIIDGEGNKVFEVEREELILRLKTTKDVEDLVNKYKKTHNDVHLIKLGKLLTKEIMTNTHDFSGKFGMEVK